MTADEARRERWIAVALLAFTGLFALVVQTLLLHRSNAIGGDIEYHRGVAYTMAAGSWQGEGPIHGVMSYFGGLYPLTLGWGSRLLGVSFDSLLSVVSWPFVLALPAVLFWLGRRLWPGPLLEPAVLTFVGTIGSSLALDDRATWVNSVLPSGSNLWPVYPRDVALVLVVAALALIVGPSSRGRTVAAGVIAGVAICVHAQIGAYGVVVLLAYALWRGWSRRREVVIDGLLVAGTAGVVSVWWWAPRVSLALDTGPLELRSFPGLTHPELSLAGLVVALGVVGLLAIPGVVLAWRSGRSDVRFVAAWLVVLGAIGLVGDVVGDLGVITPRRIWFLAAVPLVVCAAIAATAWLRRGPVALVLAVVVVAIALPSVAEALQTRNHVEQVWAPEPANGPYASRLWDPALDRLRTAIDDRGLLQVLTSDNDGLYVWEHSGAQPFGFLPSGAVKLGFDPARATDYGYVERVRLVEQAQARGLPGWCSLARRVGVDLLVVRRDGDLLGTHDTRPSARYRKDPRHRTAAEIDRPVGPGLRYLDRSATELLEIAAGRGVALGWHDPAVRRVDVYQDRKRPVPPAWLVLPDGRRFAPRIVPSGGGWILRYDTPDGVPAGTRLAVNRRGRLRVSRVVGYVPARGLPGPAHGAVVLDPARVCAGPSA